ncbi:MAG: hypothetical protein Q4G48_07470, partial [Bacteroidia bacterium]|nr:hypothetical protein [Bacteroidia bacterium]
MKSKNSIRFIFLGLGCILLAFSCSTRRNTSATRAYHELTTRYNVYFNAEDAYNETLQSIFENHNDNYHDLLPMYPNSAVSGDTLAKTLGGPFDRTVDKTVKAIQEHSITAKPRRDASQPNTQEYRDWLRQNEFNPFIDRAWLLMGQAHVQNKDYTEAISVFSQTMRLFNYDIDVVSEAQLWMMRAYTEMGWFSDAETLAVTLQARALPKNLQPLFTEFYTFLLLRKGNYRESIPFLTQTIDNQGNAVQQRRLQFLLGQIYTRLGENENAYRAFGKLKGLNVPYEVEFNALMAQSQVSGGGERIIGDLQRMTRSAKNSENLDRIYAAIGNIYSSRNNEEKAIENYLLAEKNSVRNGIDKALAQLALGDLYFGRKQFVKARPRYSEALASLPPANENYARAAFRAEVLDEMVPHIIAVAGQDSLQQLARLPETEQLKIINAHIAGLKKTEREQLLDNYLAEQPLSAAESTLVVATGVGQELFYFYNPQLVAQGRNEFRRQWGNRAPEDNWRLQNPGISDTPSAPRPAGGGGGGARRAAR